MTLEQRLFLHRQIARLLEPVPPDVRLKILADFKAEIDAEARRKWLVNPDWKAAKYQILPEPGKPIEIGPPPKSNVDVQCHPEGITVCACHPPGTTTVSEEARQMLREAADKKP